MGQVVITGAPGCGKTTVLRTLADKGYVVMPEAFRWMKVLRSVENNMPDANTPYDEAAFCLHLGIQKFCEDEEGNDVCFFDRSLIDILAYSRAYSLGYGGEMLSRLAQMTAARLTCAVVIPSLESVTQDWLRWESPEECRRLEQIILDTYAAFDIEIVQVRRDRPGRMVKRLLAQLPAM